MEWYQANHGAKGRTTAKHEYNLCVFSHSLVFARVLYFCYVCQCEIEIKFNYIVKHLRPHFISLSLCVCAFFRCVHVQVQSSVRCVVCIWSHCIRFLFVSILFLIYLSHSYDAIAHPFDSCVCGACVFRLVLLILSHIRWVSIPNHYHWRKKRENKNTWRIPQSQQQQHYHYHHQISTDDYLCCDDICVSKYLCWLRVKCQQIQLPVILFSHFTRLPPSTQSPFSAPPTIAKLRALNKYHARQTGISLIPFSCESSDWAGTNTGGSKLSRRQQSRSHFDSLCVLVFFLLWKCLIL